VPHVLLARARIFARRGSSGLAGRELNTGPQKAWSLGAAKSECVVLDCCSRRLGARSTSFIKRQNVGEAIGPLVHCHKDASAVSSRLARLHREAKRHLFGDLECGNCSVMAARSLKGRYTSRMEQSEHRRLTLDEYLALEAVSPDRLEYRDGFAVALAVPAKNHARIAGNLAMSLGPLIRGQGCDFFAGDAKVLTPNGDRAIPDFVVTCDPRDRDANHDRGEALVRHPRLVIEILSPATATDDTTDKLDAYQSIPELTHYVVIDSRRRAIRLYERMSDGSFATRGPLAKLMLPNITDREISIQERLPRYDRPRVPGHPQRTLNSVALCPPFTPR